MGGGWHVFFHFLCEWVLEVPRDAEINFLGGILGAQEPSSSPAPSSPSPPRVLLGRTVPLYVWECVNRKRRNITGFFLLACAGGSSCPSCSPGWYPSSNYHRTTSCPHCGAGYYAPRTRHFPSAIAPCGFNHRAKPHPLTHPLLEHRDIRPESDQRIDRPRFRPLLRLWGVSLGFTCGSVFINASVDYIGPSSEASRSTSLG